MINPAIAKIVAIATRSTLRDLKYRIDLSSDCSEPADRMRFTETDIEGVRLIDPTPHQDDRGRFMRAWCSKEFLEQGINFVPVQANMGFSVLKGTVRGMHFQEAPAQEAKLVRCTRGAMFDVALDLRRESRSYGKWYGTELSAENGRMLYVPEGCAHGYQTLDESTEMYYMTSAFYTPGAVRGVRFDDSAFAIRWPLTPTVVSAQDLNWPLWKNYGRTDEAASVKHERE